MSAWLESVAGSGKTRFISTFPHDDLSLCLGFSNATVEAMDLVTRNTVLTIHSMALRVLHLHTKCRVSPNLPTLCRDMMWQFCENKEDLASLEIEFPYWQELMPFKLADDRLLLLQSLYRSCVKYFRDVCCLVGYEDLLLSASKFVRDGVADSLIPKNLLVDEAQDCSAAQWLFISSVAERSCKLFKGSTVTIVGDPNQMIYTFQGSSGSLWKTQLHWWRGLPGEKQYIQSEKCYRCAKAILDVVNQIFKPTHTHCKDGGKFVLDRRELTQAECINLVINEISQISTNETVMVLIKRRGAFARSLSDAFLAAGFDIGISSAQTECLKIFFDFAKTRSELDLWRLLKSVVKDRNLESFVQNRKSSLRVMVSDRYPDVSRFLDDLLDSSNDCGRFLQVVGRVVQIEDRIMDWCALYSANCRNKIDGFLDFCRVQKVPSARVQLSTIHGAKGLEADHVIVADSHESPYKILRDFCVREGVAYPASEANLRERQEDAYADSSNLLYVAMTRARKSVYMCGSGKIAKDSFTERVSLAFEQLGASNDSGVMSWCDASLP